MTNRCLNYQCETNRSIMKASYHPRQQELNVKMCYQ